jgi:hypothetical protein
VADRVTWARATIEQADADYGLDVQGVDARLRGYRDEQELPGTRQGRMRVLANDGFHSRADVSDGAFRVPNAPPQVAIASPRDGSTVPAGEPLLLEGTDADAEDGPPPGPYAWASSVDGALGSGAELTVRLSPGEHRLTLSVADAEGSAGTDQVTVHVVRDRNVSSIPASR